MFPRVRPWLIVAALFTLGNAMGIGWAIAMRDVNHAAVHVALTLLGTYFVWLADAENPRRQPPSALAAGDARLEQLQRAVDAVAIEVERIGEAQRFEAAKRPPPGQHPAG